MRPCAFAALALLAVFGLGCRAEPSSTEPSPAPSRSAPLPASYQPRSERPISSAALEASKELQARKLALEPPRHHEQRLAFGKGVFGQLTDRELRIFDSHDFKLLSSQALEGPRALVTLADGALLAVGSKQMLRLDPSNKKLKSLPRPVLLPGAELHADAVVPDRIWVFEPGSGSEPNGRRPKLSSMPLAESAVGLLLPDREAELELYPGGVLGTTREGVWLYVSKQQAERFGPGGARLSKLGFPETSGLLWMLPARRLDQCLLVEGSGSVSRAVVSPTFKQLSGMRLSGTAWSVVTGDEGRLVAAVVVVGEGPRFELQLFDAELKQQGRAELPAEAPTGGEDWIRVVTRNQGATAAAREPRVAVGGPDRVLIFDGQGSRLFSIPSR